MNWKKLFAIAVCLISSYASAAAPGTHLFTAQLWIENYGPENKEPQNAFVAGTLFPDIRYMGTIDRNETHEKGVTAKKIKKTSNPFTAGKRLHAFVDEKREDFVAKSKIFSHIPHYDKKVRVLFLKILEDEILWSRLDHAFAQEALQIIYQEEIDAGVEESVILKWHQTMENYFNQPPSVLLAQLAKEKKGYIHADAKTVEEWSRILPVYAQDPIFIDYVEGMVRHLQKEYKK